MAPDPVIDLVGVTVWRSTDGIRRSILDSVDLTVSPGEHWAVIGPNGAGKTTLLRVLSAQMCPSTGRAHVLGGRLGRVPLHDLRRRIGLIEPGLARRFYPQQRAIDVVLSGNSGTVLLVDEPDSTTIENAMTLLRTVGVASVATREFAICSEGERARILLARALMADARLLVLDEPTAGLDLPGRELFLNALENAVVERTILTTVSVAHHLEELPGRTSHALLLRDGKVLAAGPAGDVITDATLTECFGLRLRTARVDGRLLVTLARNE